MNNVPMNKIVALSGSRKLAGKRALTDAHHLLQSKDTLHGLDRTYHSNDDEGAKYPNESKKLRYTVASIVDQVREPLTTMFDVVLTQDSGNQNIHTDLVIGENTITDVPVTTLIFLGKQLDDLHTFVSKMPVLDSAQDWDKDSSSEGYRSKAAETLKTKKVEEAITLAEATKEHPAQAQLITKDIVEGKWSTTQLSGAISADDKKAMLQRIAILSESIVEAREKANGTEIEQREIGESILSYVFSK